MDFYDTDKIIKTALAGGANISPSDRQDWVMFGVALRVLGYDETHFTALSWQDPETRKLCRKVWSDNKGVRMDEDTAKSKIIALARDAGFNMAEFRSRGDGSDKDNSRSRETVKTVAPEEKEPQPPVFIESRKVAEMEGKVTASTLYNFLCRFFPRDEVNRVFGLYRIGGTPDFGTIPPGLASTFPYINLNRECVDIHMMPFDNNGHRRKEGYCQNWLLAKLKLKDRRAPWPLFGEHLLTLNPTAPIGLVESEKTALIATLAAPGYIWVATASESNLTAKRCEKLRGRAVYIFPDADRVEEWRAKAMRLQAEGFNVYFCDEFIKRYAVEPKDDLADIVCRWMQSRKGGEA